MMINFRKLVSMARKWRKMAGIGRRRILLPKQAGMRVADKGHFVVYSAERRRFVVPLAYLSSHIFQELLKMSEEEFGLPRDGPITLPCDTASHDYVLSVLQGNVSAEIEKAVLVLLAPPTPSLCSAAVSSYFGAGLARCQMPNARPCLLISN